MLDFAVRATTSRPGQDARLVRAAGAMGLAAGAVGALVLLGWFLDLHGLRSLGTGPVPMRPNTAVAFILCGLALWLLSRSPGPRPHWGARTLAGAAGLIGLLALLEYLLDTTCVPIPGGPLRGPTRPAAWR